MPKRPRIPPPFSFPPKPHRRVHGPRGHRNYRDYKQWLRDEFEFRCVYCLTRERWLNQGHYGFTIDHVKPKSIHGDLTVDYGNLVYACFRCNTLKSTKVLPDPCKATLRKHVKQRSGTFVHLTPAGRRMIAYLKLNERVRVDERAHYLSLFEFRNTPGAERLLRPFGYPSELPDLSRLKPPKGNSRQAGLKRSHFARQQAGKLRPYY